MSKVTWLSLVGKVTADVKETEGIGCGRQSRLTRPSGEGRGGVCQDVSSGEESRAQASTQTLCFRVVSEFSAVLAATDGF